MDPALPKDPDTYYHNRMVEILDSLNRDPDPLIYFNLNKLRARYLEDQLAATKEESVRLELTFNYALELLKAGQTEQALLQFETLVEEVGGELNAETRTLYEMVALSWLRLGEQANCIDTHTPMSCTLPIRDEGIYRQQKSARTAMYYYRMILDEWPDDLQSIWLYNLAAMTIGAWPNEVNPAYRLPDSIFRIRGPRLFREIGIPAGLDIGGVAGGVSLEDFNGDGWTDLFITGYLSDDPCRFFVSNGDGTFSEKTESANLKGIRGGLNVLHADYNNDGFQDILILRGGWIPGFTLPNSLLRNNGDGSFTDVTIPAGLLSFHPTQAAGWADVDGDGWLDLFVGNETLSEKEPHPCAFYHNNGDGTFTDMAPALGLDFTGYFKCVHWGDMDRDGRPDLYLSNLNGPNRLLHNRGGTDIRSWEWADVARETGTSLPFHSFPAFFLDFNQDGWDDLLVSSYALDYTSGSALPFIEQFLGMRDSGQHVALYRNEQGKSFRDVAPQTGLNVLAYPMGHNTADINRDGWPDILMGTGLPDMRALMPNRLFINRAGEWFEDRSMGDFGHIQKGHGIALADMDNDGDLDVYVVAGGAFEGDLARNLFYRNETKDGAWISLRLQGTRSNRDAMGARIRIDIETAAEQTRSIHAVVNTGGGFGASELRRTIGLGDARKVLSVTVGWPLPGLPETVYGGMEIGGSYRLVEGQAEVIPEKRPVSDLPE